MKTILLAIAIFPLLLKANKYYVSPSGKDSNPGTINKPFRSWEKLRDLLKPGDTCFIRGGMYSPSYVPGKSTTLVNWWNLNGTASSHIVIKNYRNENPILDFKGFVQPTFTVGLFIYKCSFIDIIGVTVTGLTQNSPKAIEAIRVDGCNNVTLINCSAHDNQGTGFRIVNGNNTTLLNCDAYSNGDPYNDGGGTYGNADGFDLTTGIVHLSGCRAWQNSDDGFDCYYNDSHVYFNNCWSFSNGFIPGTRQKGGNGMGFKWGISTHSFPSAILRTFTNCLSVCNRKYGYDQNTAKHIAEFYNCTSYGNVQGWAVNYAMGGERNEPNILRNCVSFNDGLAVSIFTDIVHDHNSWNGYKPSAASFVSADTAQLSKPRKADGGLPDITFLHLSPGSNLIGKGIRGVDLGAFRFAPSRQGANLP